MMSSPQSFIPQVPQLFVNWFSLLSISSLLIHQLYAIKIQKPILIAMQFGCTPVE